MGEEMVGRVVEATVESIEEFGVWMIHDGAKILVLIVDGADEPIHDLRLHFECGQRVWVRIERYNAEAGRYRGAVRGVDQQPR